MNLLQWTNQKAKSWTVGTVMLLVAGLINAGAAHADDHLLRIGYQKYGTLVLLKARGTLEKRLAPQGIKVQWTEFPAGPQLLEGLDVGSVDLGTTGETPPVFAQAAGANLVYLGNEPASPTSEAIVVPKNSRIRYVGELRGKRVALNKGSNVHYLLVRALEKAGLKYSDIQPVYLTPSDARAAFERGSVDAWVIWDPFLAAAQRSSGAREIVDGKGLVSNHQFYLASRPYAARHPKVIAAVFDEIRKVDAWGKQNPRAVAQYLGPQIGLDRPTADLAVRRYRFGVDYITPPVVAEQQKIADTFYNLGLIPQKITVRNAVWQPKH